jgi:hypothetical protein
MTYKLPILLIVEEFFFDKINNRIRRVKEYD